ncbi:hypothetical protein ACLBKS_01080 [Hylemonella sp. W303a]|uniref:hypothetical protein n=1 Tax=Hylemonella sp. W303a TaxID=3389873 RepID=UPI00396AF3C7
MEFVAFHVGLGIDQAVHPNQTLEHENYLSMIDMMFASVRLFHPKAVRVMLSDRSTSFDRIHSRLDRLIRGDVDGSRLMLERTRAQWLYVQASAFEQPIVMLDSDILINESLAPVFQRSFDVALTWRENDEQPVNGGLMILNNQRPEMVRRFFEKFMSIYQEQYAEGQAAWFGDQLALRDCLGLKLKEFSRQDVIEVDGCRVLLLPCDIYNFSPDNRYEEIADGLPGKRVLHFKGERKRLMGPFWRAWLRPRHSWIPWVLYRAWRERAWLKQQQKVEVRQVRGGKK